MNKRQDMRGVLLVCMAACTMIKDESALGMSASICVLNVDVRDLRIGNQRNGPPLRL